MSRVDPTKELSFTSRDWMVIKAYLQEQLAHSVDCLIGASDQTDSDKQRGRISFIKQMLSLEPKDSRR